MGVIISLIAVLILVLLAWVGAGVAEGFLFGVILPYAAIATFLVGVIYRVVYWARSPVPFRIPTTCGQQKSHSWIRQNSLDNPDTGFKVILRMALEVLFFRSLFRNTKSES